jgi:putative FmdB family regulatory protein
MPTYDYKCGACGHAFEQFQSITAAPLKKCPKCARRTLQRLIGTGGGIIFRGSGFYETDYRSESYKRAAAAEAGAPAPSSATSSSSDTPAPAAASAQSPAKKKSAKKAVSADSTAAA